MSLKLDIPLFKTILIGIDEESDRFEQMLSAKMKQYKGIEYIRDAVLQSLLNGVEVSVSDLDLDAFDIEDVWELNSCYYDYCDNMGSLRSLSSRFIDSCKETEPKPVVASFI